MIIATKLLISFFIAFAISRVFLRYRENKLSSTGFIGWILVWAAVEIAVWVPDVTSQFASILGIGRGADLIIYSSIVVLFYLVFRIYVKLEDIEREITILTQKIALLKFNRPQSRKK